MEEQVKAKIIEVRDRATYIPVLAVRMDPSNLHEARMLAGTGFGHEPLVSVARIGGGLGMMTCDPYDWGDRTMQTAHLYIVDHFDEIGEYDVVDVENILGETVRPKVSEHF
jgi:hypothetical protein